ncbi:MAG TPA: flagellar basal body P-ring formation chaperone FlgA [Opitutaceae bacterium]|nr:flagellar basal body P-ring formation chaperone FlgA [Opitutaceae bacterium]
MKARITLALLASLLAIQANGASTADATAAVSTPALQNVEPANTSSEAKAASEAAAKIDAKPEASVYTPENLLADLTRELSDHYRVNGELQLEFGRAWSPFDASVGPVTLTILDQPAVLSQSLLVRVRFSSGAKVLGETSLFVRAQLFRDVWVVRNSPERGSNFDPTELDTRRVDTLKERETIAVSEPTGDLMFARSIPAGRLLTWHDVSRRALVRKGQVIEISAVDGMLTINMKALAMESGSAGESVRVRNLDTKKEFTAQVIAESRAIVRL